MQIAIYMAEFASGKTEHFSRVQMDMLVRDVKVHHLRVKPYLYVHNIPVCLINRVFGRCRPACRCTLQSKMAQSISVASKYQRTNNASEHTSFSDQHAHG